jgi:hypothetical protein
MKKARILAGRYVASWLPRILPYDRSGDLLRHHYPTREKRRSNCQTAGGGTDNHETRVGARDGVKMPTIT